MIDMIGLGLVALIFAGLYLVARNEKKELKKIIEQAKSEHSQAVIDARQEAILSSKNTLRGQINEELLPLFPDFPYSLSDCKFSGAPIDYIVFENMSAIRDGDKTKELEIIIAEVKMNKARTSVVQKAIKEAVDSGRVRFETWRIKDNKMNIN